jgi:hypothetical protein
MHLLIECTTEYQDQLIHDFCVFACERLEIADPPSFTFVEHTGTTSFGSYTPSDESIIVAVEGRHTSDILRTLGHELVHHKQLSEGDNSMTLELLEYEANAVAGMLMRDYNKLHPEMFDISVPVEPPPGSIGDSQGAVFSDPTRPSGPIEFAESHSELDREFDSGVYFGARKPHKGRNLLKFFARGTAKAKRNKGKRIPVTNFGMTAAEKAKLMKEEMSAGGGNVAGIGIGPQGEPGVSKKKKSPILQPMLKRFKALREEFKDPATEARKKLASQTIPVDAKSLLARRKLVAQIDAKKKQGV